MLRNHVTGRRDSILGYPEAIDFSSREVNADGVMDTTLAPRGRDAKLRRCPGTSPLVPPWLRPFFVSLLLSNDSSPGKRFLSLGPVTIVLWSMDRR